MPASDVQERIASGIVAFVQSLGITQADGKTLMGVYQQTLPEDMTVQAPLIFVTYEDQAETEEESFETQMPGYSFPMAVADRQPGEDKTWRPFLLGVRKQLLDAFRPITTLPTVPPASPGTIPEVWDIRLTPLRSIPSELMRNPAYQWVVSGWIVHVATTEDWTHS